MITLRGKITRTLAEAKPVTPAITRSNLPSDDPAAAAAADSVDNAAGCNAAATSVPVSSAVNTAEISTQQNQPSSSSRPMVEEWIWRGVWAFGSLPEEDVDVMAVKIADKEGTAASAAIVKKDNKDDANEGISAQKEGENTKESTKEGGDNAIMKLDKTSEPTNNNVTITTTVPLEEPRPRPFCYRFIKTVDASDVIVPSSLLVVQEEEDDEAVETIDDEKKKNEEKGNFGEDKGQGEGVVAGEIKSQQKEGVDVKTDATTVQAGTFEATKITSNQTTNQATETAKSQEKDVPTATVQSNDQPTKSQSTTQSTTVTADGTKPADANSTTVSDPTTTQITEQTKPTKPTLPTKQTYGDPPYQPASHLYPKTSPPGGKWEGHFENIVPNTTTTTIANASKKKRDNKSRGDNRVREVFYLFFNSTPPKDAKTVFVDDSGDHDAVVADNEKANIDAKVDENKKEDTTTACLLPEGGIHVRGYGTNRFGTFEIVGSLDLEKGMLHCQRMYVETAPENETKRPKREGTGRRGRPPKNKDGTEGGKRGRKRKPSLKKRTMEDEDSTGMDIASAVKKRARLSGDSDGAPLLPQQNSTDGKPSSSLKVAPKGSGGKGKKKKGLQNKEVSISQYIQPVVDVVEPLPSDGDPLLARWRAAHYLYYQREEANPEDGEEATAAKISSVVYEGEMVNGYREGMGICLYDNDTMYEGQWKKNKEHGKGTLMTPDRSKIIYQGDWERGRMHGSGSYFYHKDLFFGGAGQYVGDFRENLRHGNGIYTFPDGSTYEGQWKENTPNGWGLFRWPDGSLYEGFWSKGSRHGTSGTLIASDGFRYEGAWVDNAMEGRGIATYPNGQVYEGMWVAGRREGRGTIRFTNGAVYEGRFKDDNMEGQGTMKMTNNAIIPSHSDDEDSDDDTPQRDGEPKNDWMIPIEFQSDISHIHQKAGFTQVGL